LLSSQSINKVWWGVQHDDTETAVVACSDFHSKKNIILAKKLASVPHGLGKQAPERVRRQLIGALRFTDHRKTITDN
jgi:hypothetical protein